MNQDFPPRLARDVERARAIASDVAGPLAEEIDQGARDPGRRMASTRTASAPMTPGSTTTW